MWKHFAAGTRTVSDLEDAELPAGARECLHGPVQVLRVVRGRACARMSALPLGPTG